MRVIVKQLLLERAERGFKADLLDPQPPNRHRMAAMFSLIAVASAMVAGALADLRSFLPSPG